jgi:hypothetical protein
LVVSVSFAAMREGCVPVTWTLHSCGLRIIDVLPRWCLLALQQRL